MVLLILVISLAGSGAAFAQDRREDKSPGDNSLPLSIELEPASFQTRTTGPYPLHVIMRWHGRGILEGQLGIEVHDDDGIVGTLISDDLVLNSGENRSTWLLPSFHRERGFGQLLLNLSWRRDGQVVWKGQHALHVPGDTKRTLILGICLADVGAPPTIRELESRLGVDQAVPALKTKPEEERKIVNLDPPLEPSDIPVEPLQLCAYDAVLFDAPAIAALSAAQRDAVLRWIRAGGGAVALVGERSWKPADSGFLQELLKERADLTVLSGSSHVRVDGDDEAKGVFMAPLGLGRVAVITDIEPINSDDSVSASLSRFLWHVHPSAARMPPETFISPFSQNTGIESVAEKLLPTGVRAIPLQLLAIILAVFVILVGPMDFLVLRWLGRKKWTWFTFPAVTLLTGSAALALSHRYLYSEGPRREMAFIDVVGDGEVARESKISLYFEGSTAAVTTETSRGIVVPFGRIATPQLYEISGRMGVVDMALPAPPTIYGRTPHHSRLVQLIRQWTPQAIRSTTIPLAADEAAASSELPAFPWARIGDLRFAEEQQRLRADIMTAFGTGATAYLFHRSGRFCLVGEPNLFPQTIPIFETQIWGQPIAMNQDYPVIEQPGDIFDKTTVRSGGIFEVLSRISPSGDLKLEDLPLIDRDDDAQAALVIVVPGETGWKVFRRAYRMQPDGHWK
jgi:hypothetical protein